MEFGKNGLKIFDYRSITLWVMRKSNSIPFVHNDLKKQKMYQFVLGNFVLLHSLSLLSVVQIARSLHLVDVVMNFEWLQESLCVTLLWKKYKHLEFHGGQWVSKGLGIWSARTRLHSKKKLHIQKTRWKENFQHEWAAVIENMCFSRLSLSLIHLFLKFICIQVWGLQTRANWFARHEKISFLHQIWSTFG